MQDNVLISSVLECGKNCIIKWEREKEEDMVSNEAIWDAIEHQSRRAKWKSINFQHWDSSNALYYEWSMESISSLINSTVANNFILSINLASHHQQMYFLTRFFSTSSVVTITVLRDCQMFDMKFLSWNFAIKI